MELAATPGAWWLLVLACAFVAEVLGTMAGFGAATILTPIAAWAVDVKTAIALVAGFHLVGTASRLLFFGRFIHWRTWAQFGLAGILCSALGARVTAGLDSSTITLLFGAFLLLYVGWMSRWADRLVLPKTSATLLAGGSVSGFIAGLLGTGGAVRSACLLVFGLPKDAYLGTSAAIAMVVDATRLPIYVMEGLLPSPLLPALAGLTVAAFAGAWVGQRLVRRVSAELFRRFVLGMLALMGLHMLWKGWRG